MVSIQVQNLEERCGESGEPNEVKTIIILASVKQHPLWCGWEKYGFVCYSL